MRKPLYALAISLPLTALILVAGLTFGRAGGAHAAAVCTPTGYMRDNINMTAAIINPTSIVRSRVNATGCNIGVYYGPGSTGTVNGAEIFGANYFGVVNNGGTVTVTHARIHDIGESPFNGDQHGVGIYFVDGSSAKGKINANIVWSYQKGGIVVNGIGSQATITNNIVIGNGPVDYIAQNGIEVGDGSTTTVTANIVAGNSYTGSGLASSGGILLWGGSCYGAAVTTNTVISGNTLIGNDVGVYLSNLDTDPNNANNCIPTATTTTDTASKNVISNDAVTNTSGYGTAGSGYQAGVSDQGTSDKIISNNICGVGYTPVTPPPYLYYIDVTATNTPFESGNTTCSGANPLIVSHAQSIASRAHLSAARISAVR